MIEAAAAATHSVRHLVLDLATVYRNEGGGLPLMIIWTI